MIVQLDVSILLSVLSVAVSLTVVINFLSVRRKEAMAQGAKEERISKLCKEVEDLVGRIRTLETSDRALSENLIEIREGLKHVLNVVERLENKMDKHLIGHQGEGG